MVAGWHQAKIQDPVTQQPVAQAPHQHEQAEEEK